MSKFFHGWRRKLGVVTLLMACVIVVLFVCTERQPQNLTEGTPDTIVKAIGSRIEVEGTYSLDKEGDSITAKHFKNSQCQKLPIDRANRESLPC